ncbi:MAG: 2-amino-3,7-dideoxy-D-threo-hept-6-ulosonate synthase [Ignavibacteriales bacterium]|nr:2-amino-3,7-dideoxy-D-threo-hept-6-ulosonate synthase [Ignavibacteriales bacterium]
MSFAMVGKNKRLSRLFDPKTMRTVITPIDDSLIFGPFDGLADMPSKLQQIVNGRPNGILTFQGIIRQMPEAFRSTGTIINLSASTSRMQHTNKILVSNVYEAIRLDADAVAVHVNITSRFEQGMLATLGKVVSECQPLGIPVLAIMYPRTENKDGDENYDDLRAADPVEYAKLVAHAVRVATDLGVDIIKTKYTGSADTFRTVVQACAPLPVVIAGGPLLPFGEMLNMAAGAIEAGAAGVSFGRNVFNRQDSGKAIRALKKIVFEKALPKDVFEDQ